jgi:Zn-dependent peptidase ImmA (M78 family)
MSIKSIEVNVNSAILRWARESIGIDIHIVSKKMQVSEDTIIKWESEQRYPTLIQLEKLSKLYKRPLAVFFLPEPPKDQPLPKDFRTLPSDSVIPLSVKTRLAIRRARRIQFIMSELLRNIKKEILQSIQEVHLSDNPDELAMRIRKQLGVEIEAQFGWKDERKAFNEWKKILEKQGVFIFQIDIPIKEARGFSLTEDNYSVIVLSINDKINGKIFSLFHEYTHILLKEGGICNMEDEYLSGEAKDVEKFCNRFAGTFLVPQVALIEHPLVKSNKNRSLWDDEVIIKLAKDFKVSQEVILRRLLILGRTTNDFYVKKRDEWNTKAREFQNVRKKGRRFPSRRCVQENGIPFINVVLENLEKENITYSDVSDYLGIRLKYLPEVERLVKSGF